MDKVYIVNGETIGFEDTYSAIAGVHTTEEGARKRMREEILVASALKTNLRSNSTMKITQRTSRTMRPLRSFGLIGWEGNFVTSDYWRYSDETDFTYVVYITAKEIED